MITRRDLPLEQRCVQSCHALIEATSQFNYLKEEHPHLVLCEVRNENKLIAACSKLEKANIKFKIFREPDRNNEITALATEPICGEERKVFKDFQLLKAKNKVVTAHDGDLILGEYHE